MLNDKTKNQVKKLHSQWQQQTTKSKPLNKKFITVSGEEINPLYTPTWIWRASILSGTSISLASIPTPVGFMPTFIGEKW